MASFDFKYPNHTLIKNIYTIKCIIQTVYENTVQKCVKKYYIIAQYLFLIKVHFLKVYINV